MASELRVNTLKDASGNNSIATSVVSSKWLLKVGLILMEQIQLHLDIHLTMLQ